MAASAHERYVQREACDVGALIDMLRRIADGDRVAFEEVYRRTAPKLLGACLQMLQTPHEAEDVLQEVFSSVWQGAGMFDPRRGTVMTWLITITHNRAVDHLRRSPRATLAPLRAANTVSDSRALASEMIETEQEQQRLRHCLNLLSARDASALRAAFFEGSTYADLALAAHVPIGTMKSRIRRALLRLRAAMAEA